ncbi:heading date 3B-like protein isoform X1 [Tanacetum coccineum]
MANVKDEGKKMDPLFPRLHISDAEKGGIRTPPRNNMSFHVPSQTTQRCMSGSVSPILPLSKNNGGSLVPLASSYHDASYKRSVFSSVGHSRGSTRMATRLDSYHSSGVNLNISLTTVKQTIETTKCQTLCNAGQLKRGDNGKVDRSSNIPFINKCHEDHPSLNLEDSEKIGDALEINNVSGYSYITPEEVSEVIGPEEYRRARRVIIQQQREFQSQLFELHRLIKVQKLLAESPDLLIEDNFHKRKKYPSEDIYPHIDHHKKESYLSFPIDGTIKKDMEKRYIPNLIDLPPPPLATSPKQSPWCFLPPPGNQWLVPVRSPSEGLVYKPYTGPTPPPVGLMAPVYGMTIPPSNGDFLTSPYNMNPTSYNQGISVLPSTPLFTSYGLPTIEDPIKYNVPIKTTCKENDLQVTKDELPLFPTTPMVQDTDKCRDKKGFDERIKVIKVVPRNPKLASESTARIFQFIQEERNHTE